MVYCAAIARVNCTTTVLSYGQAKQELDEATGMFAMTLVEPTTQHIML